jgi:hypothetical protein
MSRKRIAQIAAALAMMALPVVAFAIATPTAGPELGPPVTASEIERIITRIVTFLVTFGVIIAVGVIIWGGIMWMLAGGNDDRAASAKKTMLNGVIGAAIVLGVGVILRTLSALISRNFFFS